MGESSLLLCVPLRYISSYPAFLQCPRSLNQRLHNAKITHYGLLHCASFLLPLPGSTLGRPTESDVLICMRATGETTGEKDGSWRTTGLRWNRTKRASLGRCSRRKTFRHVETLYNRIWLRTVVSLSLYLSIPLPIYMMQVTFSFKLFFAHIIFLASLTPLLPLIWSLIWTFWVWECHHD